MSVLKVTTDRLVLSVILLGKTIILNSRIRIGKEKGSSRGSLCRCWNKRANRSIIDHLTGHDLLLTRRHGVVEARLLESLQSNLVRDDRLQCHLLLELMLLLVGGRTLWIELNLRLGATT